MKKRAGFTLLEVIVTLAIAGIMAAVAGIAVVSGVNAYLMAKNNTAISQKAQLAMARISRELIELTDVTGTAADSVIYQNTQGSRAIARVGNYIKILDGSALPTPDTGDILTDNVQTFTIQHYKGSQLWVQGADNIQLLSAIIVSLVLRHPTAGSSLTFSTTINPRNNQNVGGSPAPQPDQLAYKPSGCFIATAAYGNPNHPVVVLLKQFRDRYLLTWDGGRKVVNAYYSISPYIADAIRNHLWACSLTRMLIFPFAAIAFLLIYAPVSILLLMISSFLLLNIFIRYLKSSRHKNIPRAYGNKGTILVGLIVTITILATLGAAMLSLFSTSTFSQLSGNNAQKAYYLAESGYRYAASKFLNTSGEAAKSSALESMHNQTFSLGTDGSFQLKVYPYWYQTVSDNAVGTTSLVTKVFGAVPFSSLPLGYLKIENNYYQYNYGNGSGSSFTFTLTSATPRSISSGVNVYAASLSSSSIQTISEGGNLILLLNSGYTAFPLLNGTFKIGSYSTSYAYKKRNGNVLEGITLADSTKTWTTLTVSANSYIIMDQFIQLFSTGIFSNSQRDIIYNVPIGWIAGTSYFKKEQFHETFSDTSLPFWQTGAGAGEIGTHAVATIDGSSALDVVMTSSTGFGTGSRPTSLLKFNWAATNTNLEQSWRDAEGLLSYDLQVKVKDNPKYSYFAPGTLFRMIDNNNLYGISIIRGIKQRVSGTGTWTQNKFSEQSQIPTTMIPPALYSDNWKDYNDSGQYLELQCGDWPTCCCATTFRYSDPAIVLWRRIGGSITWLAYKKLDASSYVVYNPGDGPSILKYLLKDWPTTMVRIIEGYSLTFTNGLGTTPIRYNDVIKNSDGTKSARVNGSVILTSGSTWGPGAAGILTLSNVNGTFSNEDIYVNGIQMARAGTQGLTKENFIRAYYADTTSHGTASSSQTDNNRIANPRDTVNWPPDNLSDMKSDGTNDWFTLVQWTGYNTGVNAVSSSSEPNAIIRTSTFLSPVWTGSSSTFSPTENIALISQGTQASSFYFDDFAIQLDLKANTGFLPPIQQ